MKASTLRSYYHKGKFRPYAWPGGYPVYAVTSDGEALCPHCMNKERPQVFRSTHEAARDGWAIAEVTVNWEDSNLHCCNCDKRIESAYAEPETVQESGGTR
jgi:hypothetical protein